MNARSPNKRQFLDRPRILDVAISFADAHGVEDMTMRKIAGELNCGAMSLYNHVANKEELLTDMLDAVVGKIDTPDIEGDWKIAMRASAQSANRVLLNHHWAVGEWNLRMPGPNRTRYMESILAALTQAKLNDAIIYRGYHAITMHIVGFSQQQIGYQKMLGPNFHEIAEGFLSELGGNYPYLAYHVRAHLDEPEECDEFLFVLDLILDGLERAAQCS
ncbi:TetR/AcrR family transcriptional regulator [uncultured Litoreibacter sp.]|uniref:TetR/AcrR family transcriptional regulator n=1 Tax=uncultured Litoreibacter sp. TaxID=1392394 RepID=UPI0026360138|nr:TetR/AcrR family transcriptional regulator [uncultured Litoreibacter sp.]